MGQDYPYPEHVRIDREYFNKYDGEVLFDRREEIRAEEDTITVLAPDDDGELMEVTYKLEQREYIDE